MKARAVETTRRHSIYLAAAAAVIALAVAFMLTGGVTTAQSPLELNFESINYPVVEPVADGARTNFEVGVLLSAESQTAVTVEFRTEAVHGNGGPRLHPRRHHAAVPSRRHQPHGQHPDPGRRPGGNHRTVQDPSEQPDRSPTGKRQRGAGDNNRR